MATTLEILHWNDVHGRYAGLARLSARVREIREGADHGVLVLDGGDVEESSVRLSALTYGAASWRLLGAAAVDAAVLGNGGLLRYGPDVVPRYRDGLGTTPVLATIEHDGAVIEGAAASVLLLAGDRLVGVVGATAWFPEYPAFGLVHRDEVEAIAAEATSLRERGAQVVVLLSHCGYPHDLELAGPLVGVVDLIVGGHSHTALPHGDRSAGVPITQAGQYAEHLGRVILEVDGDGARVASMGLEPVSPDGPQDPAVLAELDAAERDLGEWLAEPVGTLPEALDLSLERECGVANLLAEALLWKHPGDVAVLMAAHCADGLPAGVVRRGDVWAATSSPANPATATLSGAHLRSMITSGRTREHARATRRSFRGRPYGLLHVAGAQIGVDGTITMGGEPLDDARAYRVTGTDSELTSYSPFVEEEPGDLVLHTPMIMPELLEAYLAAHPHGVS